MRIREKRLICKQALDLACGEGLHARYLFEKGASKVIGVDISEGMIILKQVKKLLFWAKDAFCYYIFC
jgi:predicted TPR repeat methyltransferase